MPQTSCIGCKFLFARDLGYSNWTVEETNIECAKGANPALPADRPWDWNPDSDQDNWPATRAARCAYFAPGPMVYLDVDGEHPAASQTDDAEVIALIDGATHEI